MIETPFHEYLRSMPLLQGLNTKEFMDAVAKIRFDFRTYEPDTVIVQQGTRSPEFIYIIDGDVLATRNMRNFKIEERVNHSQLLEPTSLMGYRAQYNATYKATSVVRAIIMDKEAVIYQLTKYPITRINLLNIFARDAQYCRSVMYSKLGATTEQRFGIWIRQMSQYPKGYKEIVVTKSSLAEELGVSVVTLKKTLDKFIDEGLITISWGSIIVPDVTALP